MKLMDYILDKNGIKMAHSKVEALTSTSFKG